MEKAAMKKSLNTLTFVNVTGRSNPKTTYIKANIHSMAFLTYGREGCGIEQRFGVNTRRTGCLVLLTSRLPVGMSLSDFV